ncbi:MAG TPA: hypothetical protein VGM32_06250, partial [Rhodopila sp.]
GERVLLDAVIADARTAGLGLIGRIVPTDRNLPVRNLYRGHGFVDQGQGVWTMTHYQQISEARESIVDG